MSVFLIIILFLLSLGVLIYSSDKFVDAASSIGLSWGISPFVIGVTVVAAGTSLPELAASIFAVLEGQSEIVIGNAIGSNITNILLVLGLVSIYVKKLHFDTDIMDIEIPLLLGSALLIYFVLQDQNVSTFEAIILLISLVVFIINSFSGDTGGEVGSHVNALQYIYLIAAGIGIYLGAEYTIINITKLSVHFGISSGVFATSIVALGTSLPEVVVSLMAAKKGKPGMAIGNVLGSNIFNTFAVIGIPALIGKIIIPVETLSFSLPLMLAVTILFTVMSITKRISQWEGWVLLIFYVYFIVELYK